MARMPRGITVKFTGETTPAGNAGAELCIKWWIVPLLLLRALVGPSRDVPDSCDGLEVTGVRIGQCQP